MKYYDDFLAAVNAAEFIYYANKKGELPSGMTALSDVGKGHIKSATLIEGMGREEGMRIISVNLHLDCTIKEALGTSYESFKDLIEEYNSCEDGEEYESVKKWGSYNYYFECIPVCHMADLYGSLK